MCHYGAVTGRTTKTTTSQRIHLQPIPETASATTPSSPSTSSWRATFTCPRAELLRIHPSVPPLVTTDPTAFARRCVTCCCAGDAAAFRLCCFQLLYSMPQFKLGTNAAFGKLLVLALALEQDTKHAAWYSHADIKLINETLAQATLDACWQVAGQSAVSWLPDTIRHVLGASGRASASSPPGLSAQQRSPSKRRRKRVPTPPLASSSVPPPPLPLNEAHARPPTFGDRAERMLALAAPSEGKLSAEQRATDHDEFQTLLAAWAAQPPQRSDKLLALAWDHLPTVLTRLARQPTERRLVRSAARYLQLAALTWRRVKKGNGNNDADNDADNDNDNDKAEAKEVSKTPKRSEDHNKKAIIARLATVVVGMWEGESEENKCPKPLDDAPTLQPLIALLTSSATPHESQALLLHVFKTALVSLFLAPSPHFTSLAHLSAVCRRNGRFWHAESI